MTKKRPVPAARALAKKIRRDHHADPETADSPKCLAAYDGKTRFRLALELLTASYPPGPETNIAIQALQAYDQEDKVAAHLRRKLHSNNWRIRASAAAALEAFAIKSTAPALDRAASDANASVRVIALHSLMILALGEPSVAGRAVAACARSIKTRSSVVRRAAFSCLAHLPGKRSRALLETAKTDADHEIRREYGSWIAEQSRSRRRSV